MKNDPPFEAAVSPVVGIMLLLVVTLILAAIISGMTGGIAQTQQKPPQLVFEASMVNNTVHPEYSFLEIRVISVSNPIPTKDLRFQIEWKGLDRQIHHSTVTPSSANMETETYPRGFGPGVTTGSSDFGNYTLMAGTRLNVNATVPKAMDSLLTDSWDTGLNGIIEGTPVRIQFVHIPSGSIIADKEITAETEE